MSSNSKQRDGCRILGSNSRVWAWGLSIEFGRNSSDVRILLVQRHLRLPFELSSHCGNCLSHFPLKVQLLFLDLLNSWLV